MEIERRLPGGLNLGSEPITAFAAASRGNRFLIEPAFPTLIDLQMARLATWLCCIAYAACAGHNEGVWAMLGHELVSSLSCPLPASVVVNDK